MLQWDARTGEGSEPIKVFDATGTVIRIGDGGTLMAAARDGRIATIQPDSQRPVGTALQSLPELAYGGDDGILDLAITPTGAVTLDQSGRIVTWDVTGRPAIEQPPSGRRLLSDIKVEHATGMTDGSVLAAGESSVWRLDGESGDVRSRVDGVVASAIAVRGDMIAIGTVPGVVRVGIREPRQPPRSAVATRCRDRRSGHPGQRRHRSGRQQREVDDRHPRWCQRDCGSRHARDVDGGE